jgi:hypothetical protein
MQRSHVSFVVTHGCLLRWYGASVKQPNNRKTVLKSHSRYVEKENEAEAKTDACVTRREKPREKERAKKSVWSVSDKVRERDRQTDIEHRCVDAVCDTLIRMGFC